MTDRTAALEAALDITHAIKAGRGFHIDWLTKKAALVASALSSTGDERREAIEALKAARQFIQNGIELRYIRMPDMDTDPAHSTLPKIEAALRSLLHADGGEKP